MDQTVEIAKIVLSELEPFEIRFQVKDNKPPFSRIGAKESYGVYENQYKLKNEPLIAYVRVNEI